VVLNALAYGGLAVFSAVRDPCTCSTIVPLPTPKSKSVVLSMAVGAEYITPAADNRREYASKIGADYYEQTAHVTRCWSLHYLKLVLVQSAFHAGYEYVMWVDGSAAVVDYSTDFKQWLTGHDLALAGDLNFAVNLGNFAVRKSEWSESLLTDACKRVSPFYKEIGTINGGFAQVLFGCPSYGAMNLFFHGCQDTLKKGSSSLDFHKAPGNQNFAAARLGDIAFAKTNYMPQQSLTCYGYKDGCFIVHCVNLEEDDRRDCLASSMRKEPYYWPQDQSAQAVAWRAARKKDDEPVWEKEVRHFWSHGEGAPWIGAVVLGLGVLYCRCCRSSGPVKLGYARANHPGAKPSRPRRAGRADSDDEDEGEYF
jgi:hypothetical protein